MHLCVCWGGGGGRCLQLALCLNWGPVAAITLYVIKPERVRHFWRHFLLFPAFVLVVEGQGVANGKCMQRNTAEAVSILMTHLFGDAMSPYLVGLVGTGPARCGLAASACSASHSPTVLPRCPILCGLMGTTMVPASCWRSSSPCLCPCWEELRSFARPNLSPTIGAAAFPQEAGKCSIFHRGEGVLLQGGGLRRGAAHNLSADQQRVPY